jgi:DnaJ-domain-containing protein 1
MGQNLKGFGSALKDLQKGPKKMPSVSVKQREAMAIAEHHPDKVFKRNEGMLKMSHSQLHDFASTPEKGLPEEASPIKKSMKKILGKGKS